jgi:hypothetical protein
VALVTRLDTHAMYAICKRLHEIGKRRGREMLVPQLKTTQRRVSVDGETIWAFFVRGGTNRFGWLSVDKSLLYGSTQTDLVEDEQVIETRGPRIRF